MNAGAISEIRALDPDAVVVKGDLTDRGSEEEYQAFLDAYTQLGARMHHVRGNHDAMITDTIAANAPFTVELPGVTLAVLDTVRPGAEHGRIAERSARVARRASRRRRPRRCSCSATITRGIRAPPSATTTTSGSIPTTAKRCAA